MCRAGGEGREFLVDGVNYPVDPKLLPGGKIPELIGRGRAEVKPGSPRTDDVFLHLIQVGDQSLETMSDAQVTTGSGQATLTFDALGNTVTLSFATTGDIGGHIRLEQGGAVLVDKELTRDVLPQSGLAPLG